jgi:hypothetical protein
VPALEPEPIAEPEETEAAPEPERQPIPVVNQSSGSSTLGWVALGVGVVGVGLGSYFGLTTFSKKKEADDHCGDAIGQSDANSCDQKGLDLRDEAQSAGTLSTIGFAVGAIGVGAGIYFLATSGGGKEKSARALWVSPAVGPKGGAVTLGGRL